MPRVSTDDDRRAAARELLDGLAAGDPTDVLLQRAHARHPKNDTFPGEPFLDVARDALEAAGASRDQPFEYEGFVATQLPDVGSEDGRTPASGSRCSLSPPVAAASPQISSMR